MSASVPSQSSSTSPRGRGVRPLASPRGTGPTPSPVPSETRQQRKSPASEIPAPKGRPEEGAQNIFNISDAPSPLLRPGKLAGSGPGSPFGSFAPMVGEAHGRTGSMSSLRSAASGAYADHAGAPVNLNLNPQGVAPGAQYHSMSRRVSEVRVDEEDKMPNVFAQGEMYYGPSKVAAHQNFSLGTSNSYMNGERGSPGFGYNQSNNSGLKYNQHSMIGGNDNGGGGTSYMSFGTGVENPTSQRNEQGIEQGKVMTSASAAAANRSNRRRMKKITTLNADENQSEITAWLMEAAKLREKYTPCGDHVPLWENLQRGKMPVREIIPYTFRMGKHGVVEVFEKSSTIVEQAGSSAASSQAQSPNGDEASNGGAKLTSGSQPNASAETTDTGSSATASAAVADSSASAAAATGTASTDLATAGAGAIAGRSPKSENGNFGSPDKTRAGISAGKQNTGSTEGPMDATTGEGLTAADKTFSLSGSAAQLSATSTSLNNFDSTKNLFPMPSLGDYYTDMARLFQIRTSGPVVSHCFYRLKMLRAKFELYHMVNYGEEQEQQKNTRHRDFYNVRKVDNHIHHAAAMNVKHLTRFMKRKFKKCSEDIVGKDDQDAHITLGDLAREMHIEWHSLTINSLQMWTDRSCMHRFDRFNNKYMPMGHSKLRTLFLKTDNMQRGRYFAEITRELLDDLEEYKYQHTEWRLSIYGRKRGEWDALAKWVLGRQAGNGTRLISANNQWMIQIPRLFEAYKTANQLNNFQEMIDNIFIPLFEVTVDPTSHPELEEFLQHVGGFDTVDDESKTSGPMERHFSSRTRTPGDWDVKVNPSYKYYSFFIQTNLRVLNKLREKLHLNQFKYRPHAGEAGEVHHLDTAFLLADGINHGINLKKNPPLQYLFYLCQIGLSMSPCSNNQLFLSYDKNPFYSFFQTGLNVTLSTDDPLMFHQTKEPLLEEYAIAKQLWKLSPSDLCEIARNSVWQCSYPMQTVLNWLGLENPDQLYTDNSIYHTNVPESRFRFRRRALKEEWLSLHGEEGQDHSDWEDSYQLLLLSPQARNLSGEKQRDGGAFFGGGKHGNKNATPSGHLLSSIGGVAAKAGAGSSEAVSTSTSGGFLQVPHVGSLNSVMDAAKPHESSSGSTGEHSSFGGSLAHAASGTAVPGSVLFAPLQPVGEEAGGDGSTGATQANENETPREVDVESLHELGERSSSAIHKHGKSYNKVLEKDKELAHLQGAGGERVKAMLDGDLYQKLADGELLQQQLPPIPSGDENEAGRENNPISLQLAAGLRIMSHSVPYQQQGGDGGVFPATSSSGGAHSHVNLHSTTCFIQPLAGVNTLDHDSIVPEVSSAMLASSSSSSSSSSEPSAFRTHSRQGYPGDRNPRAVISGMPPPGDGEDIYASDWVQDDEGDFEQAVDAAYFPQPLAGSRTGSAATAHEMVHMGGSIGGEEALQMLREAEEKGELGFGSGVRKIGEGSSGHPDIGSPHHLKQSTQKDAEGTPRGGNSLIAQRLGINVFPKYGISTQPLAGHRALEAGEKTKRGYFPVDALLPVVWMVSGVCVGYLLSRKSQ
ncbi:unnamed protein product [Amoebophrya sp. A25]|nr:unnamed protein product [Amoebophrya sp. A25]|eukprot:GSA25T00018715001.1